MHACPPPAERHGHVDTTITAITKRSRWQMSHIDRPWEGDVMKSTHRSTRHNRTLLACALASCMLLAAPQVLAQSTAATIRGQVSADSAPAGGATVTATNLAPGLTDRKSTPPTSELQSLMRISYA